MELLSRDYYLNYPLIYALTHGARLLAADENSVAVLKPQYNFLLLAGDNPLTLIKNQPKPDLLEICGSRSADAIAAYYGFAESLECHQLYYPHQSVVSDLPLEPLSADDIAFVLENYDRLEPDEAAQAIREERIFGLRDKGSLFAFIGLHEDLSMGMLFILPGYRRRGWGERLERALTARVLAMGELPYGHVIEGNTVSMRLQQKIGFVPCSDKVFWMW